MTEQIETVGTMLPKEIERVAKLKQLYLSVGPGGIYAATMMQAELNFAHRAIAEQDVVAMCQAVKMLQQWEKV